MKDIFTKIYKQIFFFNTNKNNNISIIVFRLTGALLMYIHYL